MKIQFQKNILKILSIFYFFSTNANEYVAVVDINKNKCSLNNCQNFFAGNHCYCKGESFAYWDEEQKVCNCACSNLENLNKNKLQMQLNIPLQANLVRRSAIQLTKLPNSTTHISQKPLIKYTPNVQALQEKEHIKNPKFITIGPVITKIGR